MRAPLLRLVSGFCLALVVLLTSIMFPSVAQATSVENTRLSDIILASARPLIEQEKLAEADHLLSQALLVNPANARAFALKGQVKLKLDNPTEGRRLQDLALNIEPDYLQAIVWAGETSIVLDDLDDAEKRLSRLDKLCGNCAEFVKLQQSIADNAAHDKNKAEN